MFTGITAGITWALETVILGIALSMTPFVSDAEALFLAPFVSTFIHDAMSAIYMLVFNGFRHRLKDVLKICRSKNFKWLVLASAIGGPIGMTGYVLAVNYMGASVGAVASAIYPAIGSALAYLFLKEKIKWYQWIFLLVTLAGVFGLSYSSDLNIRNFWLGLCGAFMCAFGWGIEGVILSKCLKNDELKSEYALQIRQTVSAIVYAVVIIPVLGGWRFTAGLFEFENSSALLIVALASLCATVSYMFYYKAIANLGVSKAMGLNITYTAWAILFTVVLLGDSSVLSTTTVLCSAVVVVCGIFAAADFESLFGKRNINKAK
ncbi:MAG: DMT family transporter [Clostridia bacterium]|nr:DMT family transporter [Clostridia bacterium]